MTEYLHVGNEFWEIDRNDGDGAISFRTPRSDGFVFRVPTSELIEAGIPVIDTIEQTEGWEQRFDSAFAYMPFGVVEHHIKQWIGIELAAKDAEIAELKERLAHPNEVKCTRCGNWGRGRQIVGGEMIGGTAFCIACAPIYSGTGGEE